MNGTSNPLNNNNTTTSATNGTSTVIHGAAVKETVKPTILEEIQPVVQRQVERTEVHQVTQPVYESTTLPTQVQNVVLPTQSRPDVVMSGPAPTMMQEQSTRQVQQQQTQTIFKPPQVQETVVQRVIEEVQPVIYRETVQPTIIRETQPIQEHVYEAPIVYHETRSPIYGGGGMMQQPGMMMQQQPVLAQPICNCGSGMGMGPNMCNGCNGMGCANCNNGYGLPVDQKRRHPFSVFGRKHHDSGANVGMLGSGPRGGLGLPSQNNVAPMNNATCGNCGTGFNSGLGTGSGYGHGFHPGMGMGSGFGSGYGNGYNDGTYLYPSFNDGYGAPMMGGSQMIIQQQQQQQQCCALHSHSPSCAMMQGSPTMMTGGSPYQTTAYSALVPTSSSPAFHQHVAANGSGMNAGRGHFWNRNRNSAGYGNGGNGGHGFFHHGNNNNNVYTSTGQPLDPLALNPDATLHSWRAAHRVNRVASNGAYAPMNTGVVQQTTTQTSTPGYYY